MSKIRITSTLIVCGLACAAPAIAQTFELSWSTVDGCGAAVSAGGIYSVGGTIGQPDASSFSVPLSGGAWELVGGFWPVAGASGAVCMPCDTNCDGSINLFDIESFVSQLTSGGSGCSACAADANSDGSVNLFDIEGFVDCLTG